MEEIIILKAVIFDMDGVVFDTEKLAVQAWKYAINYYGGLVKEEFITGFSGESLSTTWQMFEAEYGSSLDFAVVREKRIEWVNDYIESYGIPVKEGFREMIAYLKYKNIKTALATMTEYKRVMYYLRSAQLYNYFNVITCGDVVSKGKPFPDIYERTLFDLDINYNDCLAIEDSTAGIISAKDAKIPVIYIKDVALVNPEYELYVYKKVDSFFQIIKVIKNIIEQQSFDYGSEAKDNDN